MDPNTPARKQTLGLCQERKATSRPTKSNLANIKRILMSNKLHTDFRDETEIRQLETLYNDRKRWINLVRNVRLKCTCNVDEHDVTGKTREKWKKLVATEIF